MLSASRFRFLSLLLLFVVLAASACATRKDYNELDKYRPDEEELIDFNYTPRDDGQSLTSAEERAFRTLGELDRNLSQEETAIVELHFKYFVHERRGTFERFLGRTARFLPHMQLALRERGIPEDVVALAMAESGGNPNAISPAGAAGLWQFMPFTGRKYGLAVNSWIDERRDPFKATYAAADYLLKLYGDFKDWRLAIAAYNAGEGKIGRAVEQAGSRNFFDICRLGPTLDTKTRLKPETMDYVPRVIAMAKIMRNLKRLGFPPPTGAEAYSLNPVTLPPGTNLSALARSVGLTWDEFQSMNPAFRRTASPPTTETTAYVPPDKMAEVSGWLQSPDSRSFAGWTEHTVRKGDSIASIARKHKISTKALTEANGFSKLPKPGSVILIPKGGASVEPVMSAMAEKGSRAQHPSGKYAVQAGDTLFSLAHQWGTSVESIREANRLGKSNSLRIGQRLSVPGDSKKPPAGETRSSSGAAKGGLSGAYTVKPGDTLGGIAASTGVSTGMLCRLNDLTPQSTLRIGQKLLLSPDGEETPAPRAAAPAPKAAAPAPKAAEQPVKAAPKAPEPEAAKEAPKKPEASKPAPQKGKTITVAPGDTLYSLARKNNTTADKIAKANGLNQKTPIKPGQKLKLP